MWPGSGVGAAIGTGDSLTLTNLVGKGCVDPLCVQVSLSTPLEARCLLAVLESWKKQGHIELTGACVQDPQNLTARIKLLEPAKSAQKCQMSLESQRVTPAVRQSIEVTCRCEIVLSQQCVDLTFTKGRVLTLMMDNDLADNLERDREIIRTFLADHAAKLAVHLEECSKSADGDP